jgi:hypothetical protein
MSDQVKTMRRAPGAKASLNLGIIGLFAGWLFGAPGIILGIIGMVKSSDARKAITADPATLGGKGLARAGNILSLFSLIQGALIGGILLFSFLMTLLYRQ